MTYPLPQYTKALRHFGICRGPEVLALQASPFLGVILGSVNGRSIAFSEIILLLMGSLALTAHVFVFNDWTGRNGDLRDDRRVLLGFARRGISGHEVVILAVALLVVATAIFALVSLTAVLYGAAIAALSTLYSYLYGKGTPIISSLTHLVGGACHFLLGYTIAHSVDVRGIAIAAFFGLVFAAGHLNQEVRDHDGDLRNFICTNAVVFGCRRAFLASLALFTAAYGLLASLAALEILPHLLIWGVLLWPVQVTWSVRAIRNGLGFDSALWMQRRYRVLFGALGLAILITAAPAIPFRRAPARNATRTSIRASLDSTARLTSQTSASERTNHE